MGRGVEEDVPDAGNGQAVRSGLGWEHCGKEPAWEALKTRLNLAQSPGRT